MSTKDQQQDIGSETCRPRLRSNSSHSLSTCSSTATISTTTNTVVELPFSQTMSTKKSVLGFGDSNNVQILEMSMRQFDNHKGDSEDQEEWPAPVGADLCGQAGISKDKKKDISDLNEASYRGIVLSMMSSVFFTLSAVIVKYLHDVHPGQLAVFRYVGILLFTIPMVITAEVNPLGPGNKRHLLIMRGIAGASSLYLR